MVAVDGANSFFSASWWRVRSESLGFLGRKNGLGTDLLSVTIRKVWSAFYAVTLVLRLLVV